MRPFILRSVPSTPAESRACEVNFAVSITISTGPMLRSGVASVNGTLRSASIQARFVALSKPCRIFTALLSSRSGKATRWSRPLKSMPPMSGRRSETERPLSFSGISWSAISFIGKRTPKLSEQFADRLPGLLDRRDLVGRAVDQRQCRRHVDSQLLRLAEHVGDFWAG